MGDRRRGRGVSDVIATILLLALTVTLFGAIFAFVTSFPSPPAQSNNQFQASLFYPSNGTTKYIAGVRIVHLSGPATPGNALIFLKSANQPSLSVFQKSYLVSTQLGASYWNLGQTLNITFPTTTLPLSGGNITVYIVSQSTLLFSVILPGTSFSAAPTVVSTYISPAIPVVGQPFTVYAALSGSYKTNSVYVNLAGVPGASSTPQVMTQNAQGLWTYTLSSGANTNGTFYAFVNATSSTVFGQTAVGTVIIPISVAGTVNGPFSVGVILIPSPANGNTTESIQAVVSYTGILTTTSGLNVSFTIITNPYSATNKWVSWAPSGTTIVGGTSVTVVAKKSWLVPSPFTHPSVSAGTSFTIYANATVGTTTVPGILTFTPAYINTGSTKFTLIGSVFEVNGSYFQPATPVSFSIGGVAQTIDSATGFVCPTGTASSSYTNVTTTSSGTFSCWLTLAAGTPMLAANVLATDLATGQNATASFTPIDWAITSSPTSGLMNSTVTLRGVGFVSSTAVTLSFNGYSVVLATCTSGTPSGSTVTVLANGSFVACTFPVPSTASPGSNTIKATDSAGQVATFTYTVTAWTLTVSPSWVSKTSATTSVTLTGAGFAAGSHVSVVYNGSLLTSTTLSFACSTGVLSTGSIAPSSGSFVCTLTLTKDPAGVYQFTASDYPSGQVATATVSRS
jgi:hypothetical protein